MTTVRFVHGCKEIGGTFIVIETDKAKCMFDFGYANAHLLDKRLPYRTENRAFDLATLGVLPLEDGIYTKETAERLHVKPYDKGTEEKTSFFVISHMHIDHMGALDCLHPDLPVYMSEASLTLYRALAECGETDDTDKTGHPACFGIKADAPLSVGDLRVTMVPVDHDVIGAAGYLFETPDGTISYTGDFRMHGLHPEVTRAFADRCKGADLLITEGTMVSFDDIDLPSVTAPAEDKRTEYDLQEDLARDVTEAEGLLIANSYNRNVERLHLLIAVVKKAGRTFVFDDRTAHLIHAFYPEDALCIYEETMHTGRDVLPETFRVVTKEELCEKPSAYLLQMAYEDLYALCDLRLVTTAYLQFDGAPLGPYDPSYQVLCDNLEALGIERRVLSVGGHAEPYYLKWMVETIAPKVYAPIHGFRPEQVKTSLPYRQYLPEEGSVLTLPL